MSELEKTICKKRLKVILVLPGKTQKIVKVVGWDHKCPCLPSNSGVTGQV